MILNYLSLGLLIMGLTMIFYGFIFIHDIPYMIAKKNNHVHAEAIHVACWLSLFTLHAIWPIVFIWAVMGNKPVGAAPAVADDRRIADLEERLRRLEAGAATVPTAAVTAPTSAVTAPNGGN